VFLFFFQTRVGVGELVIIINERLEFDLIYDQFTQVEVLNLPAVNQFRRGERDCGFC
jgi:hypothetical protein